MNKITGLIYFPDSIFCSKDSLGKRYEIAISNIPGFFITPRLPYNFTKENRILEKTLKPPLKIDKKIVDSKNVNWGRPYKFPQGDSIVNIVAIEFLFDSSNEDYAIGNMIFNDFKDWLVLFKDYIQIFTHQDMSGIPKLNHEIPELKLWQYNNNNIKENAYSRPNVLTVTIPSDKELITYKILKKSLRLCSNGVNPRLEHILFKESINAFRTKDYRKSVLESATIVEIILTNQIEKLLLKSNNENFTKAILKRYQTLGNLLKLSKLVELNLPNYQYYEKVLQPRNKVIHKGLIPTRDDAKHSMEIADALIGYFDIPITEI